MSTQSWAEVKAKKARQITDEDRATARREVAAEIAAYHLAQIRKAQNLTQTDLAQRMHVGQRRVSTIESSRLANCEIGTVDAYVRALGGHLRLIADFGTQTVLINDDLTADAAG